MKSLFSAIALCLACASAFAQVGVQGAAVTSTTDSAAQATNAGNNQAFNPTLVFNEAAASPFTSTEVHYSGSQSVKTVPNVVAPGLVATPATCLGSKSAGGSVLGAGATAAGTVEDVPCNAREGAKLYHVMGMHDTAIERLCIAPDERKAIEAAFQKARAAYVSAVMRVVRENADGKNRPLPELKAAVRCSADQIAEDDARAGRTQVSTSTPVPPEQLAVAGVINTPARFGAYGSP